MTTKQLSNALWGTEKAHRAAAQIARKLEREGRAKTVGIDENYNIRWEAK